MLQNYNLLEMFIFKVFRLLIYWYCLVLYLFKDITMFNIKKLRFYLSLIILIPLTNCSFNDLTDLWPSGSDKSEDIVIREIPGDDFDPENSDDIIISRSELDNNTREETTVVEVDSFSSSEESVESILGDSVILDSADVQEENSNISDNSNVASIQTYVGDRILDMKEEYDNLSNEIMNKYNNFRVLKSNGVESAEVYHSTVGAISARLQIGTTPGNPILLDQYEKAQTELAEVAAQGQALVELGNQIALLSARISYLRDQTRSAKRLRGAVDEDHRNLSKLQDEIKRKTVDLTRLLEELNEVVRRRDIYLAAERRRLTLLASAISVGESFGLGLGTLKSLPVLDDDEKNEIRSDTDLSGNPIAVLKIEGESLKYNQGLYGAVSAALERAPNATFTLVAVSSSAGNASEKAQRAANAREKAGKVVSSLISMGMPADRLSVTELALAEIEDTEVRVYTD